MSTCGERAVNAILFLLAICLFLVPSPGYAGTYWVSTDGSAPWASCQSSSDPGSNYCSNSTANNSAVAGDIVYYKGGYYPLTTAYESFSSPTNSGSSGKSITFSAAPGETPIVYQSTWNFTAYGIRLSNKNYIKINGFTFRNIKAWVSITNYSSYNEISNCSFESDACCEDGTGVSITGQFCEPSHACWPTNNWIHDNRFSKRRNIDPCGEAVDMMRIGGAYDATISPNDPGENNNTVENNYFEFVGHAMIDVFGRFNVVRNNIFHNEPWITGCTTSTFKPTYVNSAYNGKYGHRNLALTDDYVREGTYNLVEGNRIGHASNNPGNAGPMNIDIGAPKNIVRYNYVYNGMQSGIYFKWGGATAKGSGANGGINNRVYNNTVYHNGFGYDWNAYGNGMDSRKGIAQFTSGPNTNNVVKNNLVYDSGLGDICGLWAGSGCSPMSIDTVSNNWVTSNGDPKFVNPSLTDPASRTLPDLSLQPSSPSIDGGAHLTITTGSGSNSTNLAVQDALYFQDGSWGSALSNRQADWIAIGAVNSVVKITSINYSTNTITLASPMTWGSGAKVWLYRKSDGAQVLYGSAPDYGAYEFPGTSQAPTPPKGFSVK